MNSDTHASVEPAVGLYLARRRRLSALLPEGLALLYRGDGPFFEDLYYLTGLTGYDSSAVIDMSGGHDVAWAWRLDSRASREDDISDTRLTDDSWVAAVEELVRRQPSVVYVGLRGPNLASRLKFLHEKCPRAALLDVEPWVGQLRRIKDAWELHCLERADSIAAEIMASTREALRVGTTEVEVAGWILSGLLRHGATRPSIPIVAFGEQSAEPHHVPSSRPLRRCDVVLIDIFGEAYSHYCCERTDTFVFDGMNRDAERRIAAVEATLTALQAAASPGVTLGQLERLAGELLTKSGFGDEYPGVCAHDVGLSEHDPTDKDVPLDGGRVVAIEPSVYVPRLTLGVRVERRCVIPDRA